MKIRTVLAVVRARERLLSRQMDPHGLRFRALLLRQTVAALDSAEGPRLSHLPCGALALLLARLGVTGEAAHPCARHAPSSPSVNGVLDTTHRTGAKERAAVRLAFPLPVFPGVTHTRCAGGPMP